MPEKDNTMPTMAPEQQHQHEQQQEAQAIEQQTAAELWRQYDAARQHAENSTSANVGYYFATAFELIFRMPKAFEPQNTHFNDKYPQQDIRMTPRFLDEHRS